MTSKPKYSNGKMQGNRAVLRLLKQDELNALIIEEMKGGIKER